MKKTFFWKNMRLTSGCGLPVMSCSGPMMHNERETAGIECGTDQFGDSETLRSNYLRGSRKDCSRGLGETSDVPNNR